MLIQRPRGRPTYYISQNIEVTVMTWTNIMLLICMPGHATTQMCTYVGKDANFCFAPSHNKQSIIRCCPLPTIHFCARCLEARWNSQGVFLQRAKVNDVCIFLHP